MTDFSTLLAELAKSAGLTPEQAEVTLGTLLGAMQLSLPSAAFAPIEQAIPDTRRLVAKGVAPLGGRTGEIAAVAGQVRTAEGAERLAEQLRRSGLSAEQVRAAAQWLVGQLRTGLGPGPADTLLTTLPGLQRLST